MTGMMLTAFDSASDTILDITAMTLGRQHACIQCAEPATDISGLCKRCIAERLKNRPRTGTR